MFQSSNSMIATEIIFLLIPYPQQGLDDPRHDNVRPPRFASLVIIAI